MNLVRCITPDPSGKNTTWRLGDRAIWLDQTWDQNHTIRQTVFDGLIAAMTLQPNGLHVRLASHPAGTLAIDGEELDQEKWLPASELYRPASASGYGEIDYVYHHPNSQYDTLETLNGYIERVLPGDELHGQTVYAYLIQIGAAKAEEIERSSIWGLTYPREPE